MSTTYYSLYVQKVMTLAKTLVVKSTATAQAMNTDLLELGHSVDTDRPETWKYYQNLAGEYHPTDTMMTVTSLDTLESIDFTKDNLHHHRATARFYQFGSKYYEDLVSRYPQQESLILGILNPVDKARAMDAEDGTILYADPKLIEPQETNLLPTLQGYITRFLVRWDVVAYQQADDLYAAAQLGILYLNIPLWVLNIRLENCHTRFTHSFHIREYLASHNRLDRYMDELTTKQQLFLYRNIRYIERNAGKQETFDWLVQHLLTDRHIPLAEYVMRHNLEGMPESLHAEVEFHRNAVNRHYTPGITNTRDLYTVLEEENPLARRNPDVFDETLVSARRKFVTSRYSDLPTKVLDSSMTDLSDSGVFTRSDFLLNHWLYWSNTERYITALSVQHPKTGDLFQIPADDAFALFLYSYNISIGQRLTLLPRIAAQRVRQDSLPSQAELRSITETRYVTEEHLLRALDENPEIVTHVSTDAFKRAVEAIHARALQHQHQYGAEPHQHVRGQVKALVDRFYMNAPCDLNKDAAEDYEAWIRAKGYDVLDLSPLEHGILANSLVEVATGVDLSDRSSLKDMQGAMLRLMSQLSSYSIQFIQNINAGPIMVADDGYQRLGDEWVRGFGAWAANLVGVDIQDLWREGRHRWSIHVNEVAPINLDMRLLSSAFVDPLVEGEFSAHHVTSAKGLGVYATYDILDPVPDNRHIVVN